MKPLAIAAFLWAIVLASDRAELVPAAAHPIAPTPEARRALALQIARHTVHNIQPDLDILKGGRPHYATDPDSLTAATQVVAIEFQTIAAANNYWRQNQ